MTEASGRIPTYSDSLERNPTATPRESTFPINGSDPGREEHLVQFYETEDFLLDTLCDFVGAGLGSGVACIVIATPAHRQELAYRLQTNGLDLAFAQARGKYFALDAAQTLTQLLLQGSPDLEQFSRIIGSLIDQAVHGQKPIRIFGEMVALLCQEGNPEAALRLEGLWNELRPKTHPFSLLCAYPISLFSKQAYEKIFVRICEQHSQVIPTESYSRHIRLDERLRVVSLLQQKALSLETEITERRAVEERLRISENRYRRLFEASTDGILLVDAHNGCITDVNPSMIHLLGTSHEHVVNRELWQIGLLKDESAQQAFLQQIQQDQPLRSEMLKLPAKDSQPCYIEWVSTLFQANGHQVIQCNVRDITDRRRAEEALLRTSAIVSSSYDAILSKDLDGIITSWNRGAERMYGYSAQEIVGQSVKLLFPKDHHDEFTWIMERIRRGEQVEPYETRRVRKDGVFLIVSVTVSPIKDSSGTIIGVSAIARDITEQKDLERQREAFVSMVTHELKNPLTALQGTVQLAQRWLGRMLGQAEMLGDERQAVLEKVLIMLGRSQQQLQLQHRLINDLLDVSRIQEDKLELLLAPCDLVELVCETVQDYQATHPSRLLILDLPEQGSLPISADRDRVQQVLSNYLANALKFSPNEEPVQVGMMLEANDVRVWVQDHGPGLTRSQQQHIWKRFYQAPQKPIQSGAKMGLGLGLYICQQLISRQQGQVGVESSPGQGATFWFSLPISPDLERH